MTWRNKPIHHDQLGQLLSYLLGAQVLHLQKYRKTSDAVVTPVLGVYMSGIFLGIYPKEFAAAQIIPVTYCKLSEANYTSVVFQLAPYTTT